MNNSLPSSQQYLRIHILNCTLSTILSARHVTLIFLLVFYFTVHQTIEYVEKLEIRAT